MTATFFYTSKPDVLLELHASVAAFGEYERRLEFVRDALAVPADAVAIVSGWAPESRVVGFKFPSGAPDGWRPVEAAGPSVYGPEQDGDRTLMSGLGRVPSPVSVLVGNGMPGMVIGPNEDGAGRVFTPGVEVAGARTLWADRGGAEALWVRWDVDFDDLGAEDQPDPSVWLKYVGKGNPFGIEG